MLIQLLFDITLVTLGQIIKTNSLQLLKIFDTYKLLIQPSLYYLHSTQIMYPLAI